MTERIGLIAWMVKSRVAPNLLMLFLIVGGLLASTKIKQEVFPEFDFDMVTVTVAYPGASPEEVEQGIVLPVEEAVRGLDGIDEVSATANEGVGVVNVELLRDADQSRVHQDIQQRVAQIRTFPDDAEDPTVTLAARRRGVLSLVLHGPTDERTLRDIAEDVRDRLLAHESITQVDLVNVRAFEIHVEVPQEQLRAHGLTLADVAARIRTASVELPGGSVQTRGGELLLRVKDRRDWARQYAEIPIAAAANGSVVRLREVATIHEGFEDVDRYAFYDDNPSIGIDVFRVGDETPVGVSDAVYDVMAETDAVLPDGVAWAIHNDRSTYYRQRLGLLVKNAFIGLVLVLIVLGLFLDMRLAFWVTLGIPTSFLGALIFLLGMDQSINIISLFAFIIALGIVVDDAIVAGENIYEQRQHGVSFAQAAVAGAKDVAVPIGVSILSNIIAFLPLLFIPGVLGKIWKVIPVVVITVFLLSWVESLLILPAHLAHEKRRAEGAPPGPFERLNRIFTGALARFIDRVYAPFLRGSLRWRWVTVAAGLASLVVMAGFVAGGRIGMIFMPRVESDVAVVTAVLPFGSPKERIEEVRGHLARAAARTIEQNGGDVLADGVASAVNDNQIEVTIFLTDPEIRPLSTTAVTKRWRAEVGELVGLRSLRFEADRGGPGSGAALTIELSHRDIDTLDQASRALAAALAEFPNVKDIDDGRAEGKEQLDFTLKPEGESLGLTSQEVARQVRDAFYGAIAVRQQRARNEVTVLVRRPQAERASEFDVESLLIRTPSGADVPLHEVADVKRGRSYTAIQRRNARRVTPVSADVQPIREVEQVRGPLLASVLPELQRRFPGLTHGFQGRQAERAESVGALFDGLLLALAALYFLLGVPFRSYVQPLVVMFAIPFGAVGAVLGHYIMGYSLNLLSLMGVVALSGVVVNDALVLVDYANRKRDGGASATQAAMEAGTRRFRPVILTTMTTFGGLAPMIFETSRQARFIIPMALSVGFGIVVATAITLVLVPALYVIADEASVGMRKLIGRFGGHTGGAGAPAE